MTLIITPLTLYRVPLCSVALCWVSPCIDCYAACRYAEFRYAECHYAECRYAECRYAESHYAECRYAECHYAECCGAFSSVSNEDIVKLVISFMDNFIQNSYPNMGQHWCSKLVRLAFIKKIRESYNQCYKACFCPRITDFRTKLECLLD